tara:strand:- start:142 stop:681 length:540 start_codon:yes stop_codon:yes gene_type:complete
MFLLNIYELFVRFFYKKLFILIFILQIIVAQPSKNIFPKNVYDIDANKIVISELSKNKTVCLITVKSVNCPICIEQLIRIRDKKDDFNKCNITFLVLAPGEESGIRELRNKTDFPFPFIKDRNLKISKRFDLAVPPFEMIPAVIIIDGDGSAQWIQTGRYNDYYSDQALSDYLDCINWI